MGRIGDAAHNPQWASVVGTYELADRQKIGTTRATARVADDHMADSGEQSVVDSARIDGDASGYGSRLLCWRIYGAGLANRRA
jgi:hypothetical protein